MAVSSYRLTVIGPDDEVLDEIPIDGLDLRLPRMAGAVLAHQVQEAMGSVHVAACAALPVSVD
jgi:hypothetical protein